MIRFPFRVTALMLACLALLVPAGWAQPGPNTGRNACVFDPAAPFGAAMTRVFTLQADLDSASENPPITDKAASGAAQITIRLDRSSDATSDPDSATMVVMLRFRADQDESVNAGHIHRGDVGVNGGVVVPLSPPNAIMIPAGEERSYRIQSQIMDRATIDTLLEILGNPSGFYVNLHSTASPSGLMRGQLRLQDDPACLREDISALQTQLATLTSQLQSVGTAAGAAAASLGSLQADVAAISAAVANLSGGGGTAIDLTDLENNVETLLRLLVPVARENGTLSASEAASILNMLNQ